MGNYYSDLGGVEWNEIDAQWRATYCREGAQPPPESPIACMPNSYTEQLSDELQWSLHASDFHLKWTHFQTRENIFNALKLPGKTYTSWEKDDLIDKTWPMFYWMYNSADGKRMMDAALEEFGDELNPEGVEMYLKRNFEPSNQRKFMYLNRPINNRTTALGGKTGWRINAENAYQRGEIPELKMTMQEDQLVTARSKPFYAEGLENFTAVGFKWDIEGRFVHSPQGVGNPYWTKEERSAATRRVMPVNAQGENFLDIWTELLIQTGSIEAECTYESCFEPNYEGGKTGIYFDHPIYGGHEPSPALSLHPGNPPGVNEQQKGGAGEAYQNPCDNSGMIESILPIAAGIAAGGIVTWFLPRSNGTYLIAGSAGITVYYAAKSHFGIQALKDLFSGSTSNQENAALYGATGVAAGGFILLHDMGLLEAANINLSRTNLYIGAAAAGFIGYTFLAPRLEQHLKFGGGLTTILTAPLAALDTGLTYLFNGCAGEWFLRPFDCTCGEADKTGGKDTIRNLWLEKIYGTTGKQREMRNKCLELEMRRGGWASTDASDENVVSRCTGVVMENPFACYTAYNWVYKDPIVPALKRTDPQEIDMWAQVSHCLDADNPSFLPPQDEFDVDCQQKYGEQFRQVRGAAAGTCKNYALPGPNNTDPVGLQDPGAYGEGSSTESCTIL